MPWSVLNIPGGKSRAVHVLAKFIPSNTKVIYSPFFGGGAFELFCATNKDIKVIASDKFEPLVNFWKCLFKQKNRLLLQIRDHLPMTKDEFFMNLEMYPRLRRNIDRAAMFFALNRASFNGAMKTYSQLNGWDRDIGHLIKRVEKFNFSRIRIDMCDYKQSLTGFPIQDGNVLFVDPPYVTSGAHYGWNGELNNGFEHEHLASILKELDKDGALWLLCYNDCNYIRTLYSDCLITDVEWYHSMAMSTTNKKKFKPNNSEIVIVSHALSNKLQQTT